MKKTILITGSNSGIGKLAVELFAKNDWQVIATMRNREKAGSIADLDNVSIYELDVTDWDSIHAAKSQILNNFEKIDVVVNNAGFGVYGAFELAKEEEIERQFDVNVKGLMRVTKAWLPHFRKNKNGLFINISSVAGLATYPLASLYISSKWAVEGFTEGLYYEVKPFGVRLKLVEPGGFRTNFQTSSITWTNDSSIDVYDEKVNARIEARKKAHAGMPDPIAVAEKMLEAANDPSDRLRYLVGNDAHEMMAKRETDGVGAYMEEMYVQYVS